MRTSINPNLNVGCRLNDDIHESFRFFGQKRGNIDERCVAMAFEAAEKLGGASMALDFVFDRDGEPRILEVSYGFIKEVYDPCDGYWDRDLTWHPGEFDPQGWMIDRVLGH